MAMLGAVAMSLVAIIIYGQQSSEYLSIQIEEGVTELKKRSIEDILKPGNVSPPDPTSILTKILEAIVPKPGNKSSADFTKLKISDLDSTKLDKRFMVDIRKSGNKSSADFTKLKISDLDFTKLDKRFMVDIRKSGNKSSADSPKLKISDLDSTKSENEFMADFIKFLRKFIEI
jgi:hypothetical protein